MSGEPRPGRPRAVPAAAPEPVSPGRPPAPGHRQRRSKSSGPTDGERVPPVNPNSTRAQRPPRRRLGACVTCRPLSPIARQPHLPSTKGGSCGIDRRSDEWNDATSVNKAMGRLADRMRVVTVRASRRRGTTDSSGTLHIETNEDGVISVSPQGAGPGGHGTMHRPRGEGRKIAMSITEARAPTCRSRSNPSDAPSGIRTWIVAAAVAFVALVVQRRMPAAKGSRLRRFRQMCGRLRRLRAPFPNATLFRDP